VAYIQIASVRYRHNLDYLSERLGSREKLCVVLKDNAYGHGLSECAKIASESGITKAMVRDLKEAQKIAELFEHILILFPDQISIDKRFGYVINETSVIETFPPETRVHLKIDTGMHRNGIDPEELEEALGSITERKLILYGVMTHFRSADELGSDLFWQQKQWREIKERVLAFCQKHALPRPLFHSGNSATVLRLKTYEDDFARCGIATYGYASMDPVFGTFDLRPVLSLWGKKISTRQLPKGARIGYGGILRLDHKRTVSTYDIGYGDGLPRFNGKGDLPIADGRKILGRVSMDAICVEGDDEKVCIFEDAGVFADFFGTIVYDILVKLSPNLARVVL